MYLDVLKCSWMNLNEELGPIDELLGPIEELSPAEELGPVEKLNPVKELGPEVPLPLHIHCIKAAALLILGILKCF
jgi:hypothetical protein